MFSNLNGATDMNQSKPEQLFKLAEEDLQRANEELYRPLEDVVAYSACQFSRKALYRFLNALAIIQSKNKNIILEPELTLEQLITFCSQHNKEIKKIDFNSLQCTCTPVIDEGDDEMIYCTSVEKVDYCAKLASKVKEIAAKELTKALN
jgi:replicative superfamily II helicase